MYATILPSLLQTCQSQNDVTIPTYYHSWCEYHVIVSEKREIRNQVCPCFSNVKMEQKFDYIHLSMHVKSTEILETDEPLKTMVVNLKLQY